MLTHPSLLPFDFSCAALYAEANRELSQCVEDWQRNSTHVNIQRLLSLLQSVFPALKQLLEFRAGGDDPASSSSSARSSRTQSAGLPSLAAALESDLAEQVAAFEEKMQQMRQREEQAQAEIAELEAQGKQARGPAAKKIDAAPSQSNSGGAFLPRSHTPAADELPPFQFLCLCQANMK